MRVVAVELFGQIPLYLYAIFLGVGASVGLLWVAWRAPQEQVRSYLDAGLVALLGGVVGGRLLYVGAHWAYFRTVPFEIPQVFLGGLAWPGILVGGLLTLALYAGLKQEPLGVYADALLPLAVTLILVGWLASWFEGSLYGPVVDAWWALPSRDEWGQLAPRLPVQIIGALLILTIFWLVDSNRQRYLFPGQVAVLAAALLSLIFFALSFLRVDPAPFYSGLRMDAWAALGVFLFASGILVVEYLSKVFPEKNTQ
jgi:phosphatidylglycerol:prolipoprotein diacylglycerol transferase